MYMFDIWLLGWLLLFIIYEVKMIISDGSLNAVKISMGDDEYAIMHQDKDGNAFSEQHLKEYGAYEIYASLRQLKRDVQNGEADIDDIPFFSTHDTSLELG